MVVKFLASTLALAGVLSAVGYWPTLRLAGSDAVAGMIAGCGVSLVASWIGAIPIGLARRKGGKTPMQAILVSMMIRFGVVAGLAIAAALSGFFKPAPLLVWVGISYVVLLPVDTLYAIGSKRQESDKQTEDS